MNKPSYMPWGIYLDDRVHTVIDRFTNRVRCAFGLHTVKISSYGRCIYCGKKVED